MIYGLYGKLAWKILTQDSLWTRLLFQKYGSGRVHEEKLSLSKSSKLWKTLFPHFQRLENMSQWQIGRGAIPFWGTNWCGEIFNHNIHPELTVCEGIQNLHSMQHLFTEEQLERIKLVELDPDVDDCLVFSRNRNGRYSIKKYIEDEQPELPEQPWTRLIWNKYTTCRVNSFMWRVVQHALPVDESIQSKGIVLSSRCVCCNSPSTETLEHVLVSSELARSVWHFLQRYCTTIK